jgi:hypothetical protein
MSLREMPDHFCCDACATAQPTDLLCTATHTRDTILCIRCCSCETHRLDADPGGRVVFDAHGWRGLHDSEHRTRRHA